MATPAVTFARKLATSTLKRTQFGLVGASSKAVACDGSRTFSTHFKQKPHPLKPNLNAAAGVVGVTPINTGGIHLDEMKYADHVGRQQNHIWTEEELVEAMSKLYYHQPKKISDYVMRGLVLTLYNTFNIITSYSEKDPTVKSIEWRLITLESVAGLPGMVAAGIRHFRSLRSLQRDHGWITTLLEEAENERMHLMMCLERFNASFITRFTVLSVQVILIPTLMTIYLVHPKSMHRFVGYLEETACKTYLTIIDKIETPGTKLNVAWKDMPAPENAIGYYKMPKEAKWVDALMCMMADETHHRDINHTFADMKSDDPNPFLELHRNDAHFAWRLNMAGEPTAWKAKDHSSSPTFGAAKKGLQTAL